jgi:hypothetical protein
VVTHYYAWRGGPRIYGEPDSAEFIASYYAAVSAKVAPTPGVLQGIITKYQLSDAYQGLAERTRRDYARHIAVIEREFGNLPIAALTDPRTRTEILEWRDKLALASDRQADYSLQVLSSILSWALDRGMAPANPCRRPGLRTGAHAPADADGVVDRPAPGRLTAAEVVHL